MKRWLVVTGALVVLASLLYSYWLTRSSAGYRLDDKARVQVAVISDLLRTFDETHGRLPRQSEGLEALVRERLVNSEGILDPWGSPLQYRCLDENCSRARVYSTGANRGDESGQGDDILVDVALERK